MKTNLMSHPSRRTPRLPARTSLKKAKVAVARKLAVIMHRMWRDETPFRWTAAWSATIWSEPADGCDRSEVAAGTEMRRRSHGCLEPPADAREPAV